MSVHPGAAAGVYPDVPARLDDQPVGPLLDWAVDALAANGYGCTGAPEMVRRRSWSTLLRLPTDRGPVWVKANARDFAYEAALLEVLYRRAPGHVLPLLAARPQQGWLVLPDGGEVLDSTGPVDSTRWAQLVADYAQLQRRMTGQVSELRRIGLLDCTTPTMTGWYDCVLARADVEPHVRQRFSASTWARLNALTEATARWAQELGRSRVPITVEHNDLHSGNVLTGTAAVPGLRIFDWGDACITHPFVGLRRLLRTAAGGDDGPAADGEQTRRLTDHYLRGWLPDGTTDIESGLRRDADLAIQLSLVVVAVSWLRLPTFDEKFGGYFASFLTDYLSGADRLLADSP